MKYRYCYHQSDKHFSSDLMTYREAFQNAQGQCLATKDSFYWVEREDGMRLDLFRKFFLEEGGIAGPVFMHWDWNYGKDDWKKLGF